jgi:hypothetical protein
MLWPSTSASTTTCTRRLQDQIAAYYAESQAEVANFAERYGVDVPVVN